MGAVDPLLDLYAARTRGMTASEVRALFAVASRPEVISLAGGMPFVHALPHDEVRAVVDRVLRTRGDVALQYGGGSGQEGLKHRLVELMSAEGVTADPGDVLVTVGAQQALDLVGKVFIDPGDPVLVEAPSYVGALSAFAAYEPRFVTIPMDDRGMIVEALEEALARGPAPKFLYTCPNFHNPAGVTLSEERRRRVVEVCRGAGIPIVEDNPYGMLRFEGGGAPSLRTLGGDGVIYLGTLSKVFSPGLRVGWVLADQGLIQQLTLFKEASDLCSSNFAQLVAEEWFSVPERWRGALDGLVAVYRRRRDAALEALEAHFPDGSSWTRPAGGFYIWATLPPGIDAASLLVAAIERRVAYVPGTAFYPDGSGRDRLRLAFCYPPEDAIREGIRRLGELIGEQPALRRAAR
ncbi:MAG TPA: PLP-dependent aminotransferase family protein [Actinomycetota bacterium]|nr:PLP-dependent aminotransferase family protein [Actinomycetota bacterium]